jgi:hypothetical protein
MRAQTLNAAALATILALAIACMTVDGLALEHERTRYYEPRLTLIALVLCDGLILIAFLGAGIHFALWREWVSAAVEAGLLLFLGAVNVALIAPVVIWERGEGIAIAAIVLAVVKGVSVSMGWRR